ncbi:hypothetical protein COU80_05075 [Candidatus Peregrinibacteria bacterium CG10_big_fil_rev_8_21_14_0_10_55_24]|nr:MAG: hypothetical protein COU80_05075 [Candidatus Peregrinibacteria bacterium CG10_big_fil_rev_8_21_14_0_10_55_24]
MVCSLFDPQKAAQAFVDEHAQLPDVIEMSQILQDQPRELRSMLSIHVWRACERLLQAREGHNPLSPRVR